MNATRNYITLRKRHLHFWLLGKGPAIVLFHPSPHTSEMLLPLAHKLALHYTVICVDTPGYGTSDALEKPPAGLEDYTRVFHEFFLHLKLEKIALYGSATGAQLAIRYALDYPEVVTHVFLDNAAHFENDFREELLMHYFPSLKPQKEGTHLNVLWDMVSAMFQYFPWCFKSPEYRLNRPQLLPEALHGIAMDFLKAGEYYHYAYRAAFLHEHAAHVQQLQPRTTIFRWEGSIILKHIDALLSFEFPDHIQSVFIPEAATERMEKMAAYMGEKALGFPAFTFSEDVGITHNETDKPSFLVEKRSEVPPDITKDGVHLLQAWAFIRAQHPELSPEEIQRELLLWYGAIK